MPVPTPIRVLITADTARSREGLASLLASQGVQVVGEGGEHRGGRAAGPQAAAGCRFDRPHHLPGRRGRGDPAAPRGPAGAAHLYPDGLRAGRGPVRRDLRRARGYLLTSIAPDRLAVVLRALAVGAAVITPHLAARLRGAFARLSPPAPKVRSSETLSRRACEVLELIAQGASNKEIGAALPIGQNTVRR